MSKRIKASRLTVITAVLIIILSLSGCGDLFGPGTETETFNLSLRLDEIPGNPSYLEIISFSSTQTSETLSVPNTLATVNVALESMPSVSGIWINGNSLVYGGEISVDLEVGQNTITVLVSLNDGTSVSCTLYVIRESGAGISDTIPPVITLLGDPIMNLRVGDGFTDPGYTASDESDGNLTASVSVTGDVDTSAAGTYVLTYTVSDMSGNTCTAERTINISPVLTESLELPDFYAWESNTPQYMFITSTDTGYTVTGQNDDVLDYGDILEYDNSSNKMIMFSRGSGNLSSYYRLTWDEPVSDIFSVTQIGTFDTLSAARTGTAVETEMTVYTSISAVPPVIILQGDNPLEIEAGAVFTDPGATVKDWGEVDETIFADLSGLDTGAAGEYSITYSRVDSNGNTAEVNRTVIVQGSLELTDYYICWDISLGYFHHQIVDGVFTVVDDSSTQMDSGTILGYDNNLNEKIAYSNPADKYFRGFWTEPIEGVFTLSYSSGFLNPEEAQTAPPGTWVSAYESPELIPAIIVLEGDNPLLVEVDCEFTDPGALTVDWAAETLSIPADNGGIVDTSAPGTYELIYTNTDSDLNISIPVTRTVIVGSGTAEIIIQ